MFVLVTTLVLCLLIFSLIFKAKILYPKYINNFPKVIAVRIGQKFSNIGWITNSEYFNKATELLCN